MNQKTIKEIPYTAKQLLDKKGRFTYRGEYLKEIAFPLGGIGSGCVSFSGLGALVDWEIFNKPNKGYQPRYSFLSLWAKPQGEERVFRVLEGRLLPPYNEPLGSKPWIENAGPGFGPLQAHASGLPRWEKCTFTGRFPFAQVELADKEVPVTATIEAWSPFIPGNDHDSSLPVAVLNVTLKNISNKSVEAALGANLQNLCGFPEIGGAINNLVRKPNMDALAMSSVKHTPDSPCFGTMTLATSEKLTSWQRHWGSGSDMINDFMTLQHFVDTFAATGDFDLNPNDKPSPAEPHDHLNAMVGSIGIKVTLKPGEQRTIPLVLAWHFPNMQTWKGYVWKNYYATQWEDATDVASYVINNMKRLEGETRKFQKALFASTLPGVVMESISTQLAILRTPTVVRFPNGTLWGWEGCNASEGCCSGTCNHVWNYQQAIPYLFPKLQRSIIENFWHNGMREDGCVQYRMPMKQETRPDDFEPAADGQSGQICWVYREWQTLGDDEWLKMMWPATKKAMGYIISQWDADKDGLMHGPRLNTLDLHLNSPDTLCGSLYQSALLAAEKMAQHMADTEAANEYRAIFESGKKLTDAELFNGEYYHQKLPLEGNLQLGLGCTSEQVHGQLYSRMFDLEDIYGRENIHTALGSLFKYNFVDSSARRMNVHRVYSVNDEAGILIATWPKGGRPKFPLLYCHETMTGFEYQVAGNLLYEGYLLEGLTVFKAIRDRFDGKKRNPYNEFECGNHYARSMANYSGLLALAGFRYSAVEKLLKLVPQVYADNFRTFFGVDSGWGTVAQKVVNGKQTIKIEVQHGKLAVGMLLLKTEKLPKTVRAKVGNIPVNAKLTQVDGLTMVELEKVVEATPTKSVIVELG